MNRLSLEQAVYRDFGYSDTPATAVLNRVRGYLNDRHRRIVSAPGRERLRQFAPITFATVAAQSTYGLEADIAHILKVVDTTNTIKLDERSLDWWRRADPVQIVPTSEGTSIYWIDLGTGPELASFGQTAGTVAYVVSTSATDGGGGAVTVHTETIDANGSITSNTTATNGTTRVQVGTATNHLRLLRMSLSAAAVGVIELYNAAAGGTRISYVPLNRQTAQFRRIALWPSPSAANTIYVDALHNIRDFTQDYDEPWLPLDFHDLLVLGAKIDEGRKRGPGDAAVTQWQAEYKTRLQELDAWINNSPDTVIIPGDVTYQRRSNLGPAFPAGIWDQ